jgi:hypothetical protein
VTHQPRKTAIKNQKPRFRELKEDVDQNHNSKLPTDTREGSSVWLDGFFA